MESRIHINRIYDGEFTTLKDPYDVSSSTPLVQIFKGAFIFTGQHKANFTIEKSIERENTQKPSRHPVWASSCREFSIMQIISGGK